MPGKAFVQESGQGFIYFYFSLSEHLRLSVSVKTSTRRTENNKAFNVQSRKKWRVKHTCLGSAAQCTLSGSCVRVRIGFACVSQGTGLQWAPKQQMLRRADRPRQARRGLWTGRFRRWRPGAMCEPGNPNAGPLSPFGPQRPSPLPDARVERASEATGSAHASPPSVRHTAWKISVPSHVGP
jgi:hypothetical protein